MGNLTCCSQSTSTKPKIKIVNSKNHNSGQKYNFAFPDSSSTSDSETQKIFQKQQKTPQKTDNFINYIAQREFEMSSIQKLSQNSEQCSQQKTFIKYLQKLQKQLSPQKDEKDFKAIEILIKQDGKCKINMKLFIEHSEKCLICYQLFQNLKHIEAQQPFTIQNPQGQNRISLRDSLLEFEQCQKAQRCEQCKCQVLNSHEEAQKAMRKFPNTNKYQSKKLKFRKTSLFQPQITEESQSQESS